jgi:NADP+-dependent farnesol dehydrogenase
MERWKGKVAIVTGASAGIGACIVENLLQAGMKVIGLARRGKLLEEISAQANVRFPGSFFPICCDLTVEHEILAMFNIVEEQFKTVHVLINCAGVLVNEKIIGMEGLAILSTLRTFYAFSQSSPALLLKLIL